MGFRGFFCLVLRLFGLRLQYLSGPGVNVNFLRVFRVRFDHEHRPEALPAGPGQLGTSNPPPGNFAERDLFSLLLGDPSRTMTLPNSLCDHGWSGQLERDHRQACAEEWE